MTTVEFNNTLLGMRPQLQWFAISLTADNDKAFDLVQDTYVKVISSKDKFANLTNLKALVFTIMKNTYIDGYRRDVKKSTLFRPENEPAHTLTYTNKVFRSPESDFVVQEIEKTMDTLSHELKLPLKMYINGYKYKEIANELGIEICTVKGRIFQARKKLMAMLPEYAN